MTRIRKTWEEILGDFEIVGDCWEYQGHLFREYGYYKYEGKNYPVHRMSYKVYVGEIPDDLVIDHLCRNHRCINPEHLEAVTSKENVLRGEGITARRARQTHCKHGHKLTPKNIYPYKGWRICRKCHRANDLKYKARKRLIKQRRNNKMIEPLPSEIYEWMQKVEKAIKAQQKLLEKHGEAIGIVNKLLDNLNQESKDE